MFDFLCPAWFHHYSLIVTFFRMVHCFCPSFLIYHPFLFCFCWMLNRFCPSLLIYYPFLFCSNLHLYLFIIPSIWFSSQCMLLCVSGFISCTVLITISTNMTNLHFINRRFFIMAFFWVINSLSPSWLHYYSLIVTFFRMVHCFCPGFLIYHPFLFCFCWMLNRFCPSLFNQFIFIVAFFR